MVRRVALFGLFGATLLGAVGCRHCDRDRRPFFDWYRNDDRIPERRGGSVGGDGILREPRSATDPYIPSTDLPPRTGRVDDLPPPEVPETRNRIDPLNPRRELLLPQGSPGASRPEPTEGLLGSPQSAGESSESKKVATTTDLPGYARVTANVATGRVPSASGWDKLKKAGFKSVAYLHDAGADVASVKKDVEARGLAFVAIPVTPDRIASGVREFNAAVADRSNRPLYVCDDDGVRTGSLWYLYFRTVEFANDDAARLLAAPLGLTDPPSAGQTTFWVAMRAYLASR
jgi:protein tyrosine phosphatase (PTP) superfamily phosphohydrolase (DUF442 family)